MSGQTQEPPQVSRHASWTGRPGTDASSTGVEGNSKVVLIGYELWERRFGKDPLAIGRKMTMAGSSYTIVGALPAAAVNPVESLRAG